MSSFSRAFFFFLVKADAPSLDFSSAHYLSHTGYGIDFRQQPAENPNPIFPRAYRLPISSSRRHHLRTGIAPFDSLSPCAALKSSPPSHQTQESGSSLVVRSRCEVLVSYLSCTAAVNTVAPPFSAKFWL
ncbi:hypothetical protein Csa_015933 [Cucumis sativus]|uniref:Uncharacterized protein n=1 Tax=Cucumis sativus TaxID=3659 RepID=A0A0A0K9H2_CUCSA|nr:hypothetical protein Csa_015933 [Cucumis sativus]